MKTVWFRFLHEDEGTIKPTGWVGMAVARDMLDLFWLIDQHGNPNSCQIARCPEGSFCVNTRVQGGAGDIFTMALAPDEALEEEVEIPLLELEVCEDFYNLPKLRWVSPKWPDNVYGERK